MKIIYKLDLKIHIVVIEVINSDKIIDLDYVD